MFRRTPTGRDRAAATQTLSGGAQHRELRRHGGLTGTSGETPKVAAWLVDDAVWCELVSDEVGLMMEGLFNRSATSVYMGLPKELILARGQFETAREILVILVLLTV